MNRPRGSFTVREMSLITTRCLKAKKELNSSLDDANFKVSSLYLEKVLTWSGCHFVGGREEILDEARFEIAVLEMDRLGDRVVEIASRLSCDFWPSLRDVVRFVCRQ